jgi:hypothetical protein
MLLINYIFFLKQILINYIDTIIRGDLPFPKKINVISFPPFSFFDPT